jgi:hypothetical protein
MTLIKKMSMIRGVVFLWFNTEDNGPHIVKINWSDLVEEDNKIINEHKLSM